jgi:hypothetical protein
MTQFHEGQEVEVKIYAREAMCNQWWKAKIVKRDHMTDADRMNEKLVPVRFTDGTRGVFDVKHIRAALKPETSKPFIEAGDPEFEDCWIAAGFRVQP